MIHTKHSALKSLKPSSQYVWFGFDYSNLNWISSDSKPTESAIDAELTKLTNAEPMRLLRVERDRLLTACDWTQSRFDTSNHDAWKTYRQSLRDLPATASPKVRFRW